MCNEGNLATDCSYLCMMFPELLLDHLLTLRWSLLVHHNNMYCSVYNPVLHTLIYINVLQKILNLNISYIWHFQFNFLIYHNIIFYQEMSDWGKKRRISDIHNTLYNIHIILSMIISWALYRWYLYMIWRDI